MIAPAKHRWGKGQLVGVRKGGIENCSKTVSYGMFVKDLLFENAIYVVRVASAKAIQVFFAKEFVFYGLAVPIAAGWALIVCVFVF